MVERDRYSDDLQPLSPEEGVEWFLKSKEDGLAESTLRSYKSRLDWFLNFCKEQEVGNLNNLTGRDMFRYKEWRKHQTDLTRTSLKTQLTAVRSFVKFCESINACAEGLHRDVILPSLEAGEDVRENIVKADKAEAILTFLDKYHYASFRHALFFTAWETNLRTGALHSLDTGDVDPDKRQLSVQHRPETGTRLKNATRASRVLAVSEKLTQVLVDYISTNRPEIEDDFGRTPLFASKQGRMSKGNLRQVCYALTRPCYYSNECPHVGSEDIGPTSEKELSSCKAYAYEYSGKCPSSESLHAVRRGGITHRLSEDVPRSVVSDRADVSEQVLEKHYDARSEEVKAEQRRRALGLDEEDSGE